MKLIEQINFESILLRSAALQRELYSNCESIVLSCEQGDVEDNKLNLVTTSFDNAVIKFYCRFILNYLVPAASPGGFCTEMQPLQVLFLVQRKHNIQTELLSHL